jgi:hypothetical protein
MSLKLAVRKRTIRVDIHEKIDDPQTPVLASFWCEPLTPSETEKLLDKHMSTKWEAPDKKSPKQRFVDPRMTAYKIEKVQKVIVRWEGVENEDDGSPIECTNEMKKVVFENNPSIINYVLDEVEDVMDIMKEEKKDKEKNFEDSASGE